ncbi:YqeG family HAD IIIA-type phosphatase [bacterium]|nr:YqeG family HAD IIIA-type phosphatase [bacterium]
MSAKAPLRPDLSHKSRGARPDFCFSRAVDISLDFVRALRVKAVVIDIDNTITRWESKQVGEAELSWMAAMRQDGLQLRYLSNGLAHKVAAVVDSTGIAHADTHWPKPLLPAFRDSLRELRLDGREVLMVGDSVMTDIVTANKLGMWTALVEPMGKIDFAGTKLYRLLEQKLKLRRPLLAGNEFRD